ncbi:MAG: hypothetical protein JWM35_1737 [Verrucomicrobia bacterium]|nr:hypothetical protein [Verrucomicrobiota bacterium]
MKQKNQLALIISAVAISLGSTLAATAQTSDVAVSSSPTEESGAGMIGTNYSALSFRYSDLKSSPASAFRGAEIEFNQAWKPGLDFSLSYDWARASADALRLTSQDLNTGVTVFSKLDWGKPFVQALAGWEWRRGGGGSDNSFAYTIGTGVEFQLSHQFVVTPYINFVRATGFNRSELDYGVKGTYRITRQWGVSVGAELDAVRHAKDAMTYTVGVNYHY